MNPDLVHLIASSLTVTSRLATCAL